MSKNPNLNEKERDEYMKYLETQENKRKKFQDKMVGKLPTPVKEDSDEDENEDEELGLFDKIMRKVSLEKKAKEEKWKKIKDELEAEPWTEEDEDLYNSLITGEYTPTFKTKIQSKEDQEKAKLFKKREKELEKKARKKYGDEEYERLKETTQEKNKRLKDKVEEQKRKMKERNKKELEELQKARSRYYKSPPRTPLTKEQIQASVDNAKMLLPEKKRKAEMAKIKEAAEKQALSEKIKLELEEIRKKELEEDAKAKLIVYLAPGLLDLIRKDIKEFDVEFGFESKKDVSGDISHCNKCNSSIEIDEGLNTFIETENGMKKVKYCSFNCFEDTGKKYWPKVKKIN